MTVAIPEVDESVIERWIVTVQQARVVPPEIVQEYLLWYEYARTLMQKMTNSSMFVTNNTILGLLADFEALYEGTGWLDQGTKYMLRQAHPQNHRMIRKTWEIPLRTQFAKVQAFALVYVPARTGVS